MRKTVILGFLIVFDLLWISKSIVIQDLEGGIGSNKVLTKNQRLHFGCIQKLYNCRQNGYTNYNTNTRALNVERTGSPKELGLKLGICERSVFNYISFMKLELEAPIIYDSGKESYCYMNDCELNFKG